MLQYEENPKQTCRGKNFIGKVMFLIENASRPGFGMQQIEVFLEKIDVFLFVTKDQPEKISINRNIGTSENKPITFTKKQLMNTYMFDEVLHAIK